MPYIFNISLLQYALYSDEYTWKVSISEAFKFLKRFTNLSSDIIRTADEIFLIIEIHISRVYFPSFFIIIFTLYCRIQNHSKMRERKIQMRRANGNHGTVWRWKEHAYERFSWLQVRAFSRKINILCLIWTRIVIVSCYLLEHRTWAVRCW